MKAVLIGGLMAWAAWQPVARWEVPARLVRWHPETGYTYAVDAADRIRALDPQSGEIAANQWVWQGPVEDVDALKGGYLFISFEGWAASVVAGPFLEPIQRIIWAEETPYDVGAACASQYGWLWIYDHTDGRLKRLDRRLQVEFQSPPLSTLENGVEPPRFMREHDGRLYTAVPGAGIWVWDIYGNFLYRIPLDVPGEFWVAEGALYYAADGRLFKADALGGVPQSVDLTGLDPAVWPIRSCFVHGPHLWTATDRDVTVWEKR